MAALTLALTLTLSLAPAHADEPPALGMTSGAEGKPHTVTLDLRIAGLSAKGCDVDIKPGHPGCKFRTVSRHIGPNGIATVVLKDVVARNADRDCTFAITLREPGQADRTVHRGLRLQAENTPDQRLNCYLSSPSRIARANSESTPKR
jgi:hypothetical protein